jgi:hypothetical protein
VNQTVKNLSKDGGLWAEKVEEFVDEIEKHAVDKNIYL